MTRVLRIVGLAALFFAANGLGVARADDLVVEKPAVVNDTPNAWADLKAVVDVLEPTPEVIYDFESEDWVAGLAGSLYDFTSSSIYLGRIKGGYASSNVAYTGLDLDLAGLSTRYLQGRWTQLDRALEVVGKHSSVGYVLGYNTELDQAFHGPSFGVKVVF